MKNKRSQIQLTDEEAEYFTKFSDQHLYNTSTEIIYRNQIPMAAYILIKGSITLRDSQKKIVSKCTPKTLLGFYEIYHNEPYRFTAEIEEKSTVLILHRSAIFEIKERFKNKESQEDLCLNQVIFAQG